MKYFRSYPWGLQLLLFFLMAFTFWSFTDFVILNVFPKMTGFATVQLTTINPSSPQALINAAIIIQGMGNVFFFLIPALVFAYLTHPRPVQYLGLNAPVKKMHLLLAILIMIGAWPVLSFIENLISHINFGPDIKAQQKANEDAFNAFLNMRDFGSFLKVFTVIAIVPALGEEMFFRGVLMRFVKKRSKTMLYPIVSTAIVFAWSHSNPYGYLSIFLAGVLLAVIYNLTGSLWCNIAAHLFFNGTQIILSYLGNNNAAVKSFMANNDVPVYMVISGAVVFAISFYLLLKSRTPLPANWADDFTPEELVYYKSEMKG